METDAKMETKELIKELMFGVAPISAGVYLFEKNIIVSFLLLLFGCIIIGILVWNYLQREKAMRSSYGYGYLR